MHHDIEPGVYTVDLFNCPPFKMFHWHDCPRAQDILKYKSFEPMSMKLWCELVEDAELAVDVGAHVGIYGLAAAAKRPDLEIHAYEPNPDCYARLQLHSNINKFDNVKCFRTAIADKNGITKIGWSNMKGLGYLPSGSQIGDPPPQLGWNEAYIKAEVLHLPTLEGLIAVKIDVEGAEYMVFRGMIEEAENRHTLPRPHIILECFSAENADRITELTKPLGYEFYLIYEDTMEIVQQDRLIACDPTGKNFNQYLKPSCLGV